MVGICPSMIGLRQDNHNSALQLLLTLLDQSSGGRLAALVSRNIVLVYKAALLLSVVLLAVLYSLILVAVGRAYNAFVGRHVSPLTSLVSTPAPLMGPARPTCNYPFPSPFEMLWYLHQVTQKKSAASAYPGPR
jgi:hypothetical protein